MISLVRRARLCLLATALATGTLAPAAWAEQPVPKAQGEVVSSSEAQAQKKVEAKQSQIDSFTLDNGLQVVVIPDHRAPIVTHMIWYKVGAADEQPGVSGIAHFLEHLMFKGTEKHPEGEFSQAVADIGGQENAFTTQDYTAFFQQVAADQLEMVMGFEADRMENLVLSDEQVLPERDVILEERRMRTDNDPGAQLSESVQATLFENSPYGIPVIGWRNEMEQLSREDAIEFYDKYYTPNNATLIVAGDVTSDEVRKLAEATYGMVPRRADPGQRVRPQEPEPLTARTVTLTDARVTQPSLQRAYLVPSDGNAESGEAEALDVLADILGGGTTSRFYRSLIVDQAIAAGAGTYYAGTALDDGQFIIYGTPRGDATLDQIEAALDAEIAKVVKDGITEDELERAKNHVRKGVIYERDNQAAMARRYGAALSTGRSIEDVETWPDRIEAVTVDQVNAVARKYLKPERSVTGYLKPEPGAGRPAAEGPAAAPVIGPDSPS
ncbi:M16 family metallopeptidase [Consotaella aegiceratis]|uniref:M16 family metallopeptidase n=1 Tax=Consotaella aegiceratis TaxID=3097961 RepID=UPI002F41D722